jgi:hypothetical protein
VIFPWFSGHTERLGKIYLGGVRCKTVAVAGGNLIRSSNKGL